MDPRTVKRRAERLLDLLGLSDRELSVLLTDDERIRELNRDWRGIDRATDVLAFPMDPGGETSGERLLGDVVISVETARRQASRRALSDLEEITALLVHGVLHLVGRDHETPEDAAAMEGEARHLEELLNARGRPGRSRQR